MTSNFMVLKALLTINVLCLLASCSIREKDDSVVLARVNEQVLTVKKLEKLLPPEDRTDMRLKSFIHEWVDNALFFNAATKDGFHKDRHLKDVRDRYYKKIMIHF